MSDLKRIIWLASYPKSGRTWTRLLLAHYFMPKGEAPDINNIRKFTTGDVRRDFFDAAAGGMYVGKSIDEWMAVRGRALRLIAGSRAGHHFVITHCRPLVLNDRHVIPPDLTAAAIYIMRNPFDVAPSFARHNSCDVDQAIDMMVDRDFVTGYEGGIFELLGSWGDHVRMWTEAPGLPLHVIRYEDMLNRPGPTVRALLEKFLKVEVDSAKLAYAVKSTSFDNLRKQEETLGFVERPEKMQAFFAKGQAGAWREDLTPAQVGRLREAFLPMLEKWYPEYLAETAEFAAAG
jgi:hypothetical protein